MKSLSDPLLLVESLWDQGRENGAIKVKLSHPFGSSIQSLNSRCKFHVRQLENEAVFNKRLDFYQRLLEAHPKEPSVKSEPETTTGEPKGETYDSKPEADSNGTDSKGNDSNIGEVLPESVKLGISETALSTPALDTAIMTPLDGPAESNGLNGHVNKPLHTHPKPEDDSISNPQPAESQDLTPTDCFRLAASIDLFSLFCTVEEMGGFSDADWPHLSQKYNVENLKSIYKVLLLPLEHTPNKQRRLNPLMYGLGTEAPKSVRVKASKGLFSVRHSSSLRKAAYAKWVSFFLSTIMDIAEGESLTLKEIMDRDMNHQGLISALNKEKEQSFWASLTLETPSRTQVVAPFPSTVCGSLFSDLLLPFNIKDLNLSPNALFGALGANDVNSDIFETSKVCIGTMLGCQNWQQEEHYTQLCSYHALGACRRWYFIPESDADKFYELVLDLEEDTSFFSQKPAFDEAAINAVGFGVPVRARHLNDVFEEFRKELAKPLSFKRHIFVTLEMLAERGIRYTTTVQKPGEFVFKYPKAYSACISLGFSLSEQINFASKLWLDYALEGEQRLSQEKTLPCFLTFKLLINIAQLYESFKNTSFFSADVYKRVLGVYDELLQRELELRQGVRLQMKVKEVTVEERNALDSDSLSDLDFSNVYPTKVVINDTYTQQQLVFGLKQFLDIAEKKDKRIFEDPFMKVELHSYLSDERMKNYGRLLSDYSVEYNEWSTRYEDLLQSNENISLKTFRTFLAEGQKISAAISASADPEAETFKMQIDNLQHFVEKASEVIEECQALLTLKHQQRIRGSIEDEVTVNREGLLTLLKLVKKIPNLNFSTPEFEQVFEFKNEIQNFDRACRALIERDSATASEMDDMITLGTSFGLKIPSLDFLSRLRGRSRWNETFEVIVGGTFNAKEVATLEDLERFRARGAEVLGEADLDKLRQIDELLKLARVYDAEITGFLALVESLNTIDLDLVDRFIEDMEAKAKSRQFVNMETYHKLVDIRANSDLVKFIQTYGADTFSLDDVNQKLQDLKARGLRYDDSLIRADVELTLQWNEAATKLFRSAKIVSVALLKKIPQPKGEDTFVSKQSALIFNKASISFDRAESDSFEHLSSFYALTESEVVYDDKNPMRYCLCREYEGGTMIECDRCHEWYHVSCVKDVSKIPENDDKYSCPACLFLASKKTVAGLESDRLNVAKLEELVAWGRTLRVQPVSSMALVEELVRLVRSAQQYFGDRCAETHAHLATYQMFLFRKLFGAPVLLGDLLTQLCQALRSHAKGEKRDERPVLPPLHAIQGIYSPYYPVAYKYPGQYAMPPVGHDMARKPMVPVSAFQTPPTSANVATPSHGPAQGVLAKPMGMAFLVTQSQLPSHASDAQPARSLITLEPTPLDQLSVPQVTHGEAKRQLEPQTTLQSQVKPTNQLGSPTLESRKTLDSSKLNSPTKTDPLKITEALQVTETQTSLGQKIQDPLLYMSTLTSADKPAHNV